MAVMNKEVKQSPNGKSKHNQRSKNKQSPTGHEPSPNIENYLNDTFEIRSDHDRSSIISDIDKLSHSFNTRVKSHYRYLVKLLPILIIFLPSLLKIFFPDIIKLGHFEIGDAKANPSTILIDLFSILLICWIIKFLLDWPWKWYTQINEIKLKLYSLLESSDDSIDEDFQNITNQNLTVLKIQHTCALIMCVLSPFLSGILLFIARDYIVVIGNNDGTDKSLIFSDLNIGIFVSCGIIRVVIQISEHIQQSTAAIEINTEKFIIDHNHRNSLRIEMLDKPDDTDAILDRLTTLEHQFKQLSKKFETFYNTNKLSIENNSPLLSSKHYKILEKEINELHYKLHIKTNELEQKFASMYPPDSSKDQLLKSHHASSLHGIPLSPMKPSYVENQPGSRNSFFPIDQYNKITSPLSKLGLIFPIFNESNAAVSPSPHDQTSNEIAIKELSNLDALNKYDLTSRPIVEYVLNFPFFCQRLAWKIVSYIPISVLRGIHFILLSVLDILLSKVNEQTDDEMNVRFKQREMPMSDESLEEIVR